MTIQTISPEQVEQKIQRGEALELIDVAKKMNIRVPEDLSVVGFDNNPLVSMSSVSLATVAQPLVEMGRLGMEKISEISRGKAKLPVKTILPTKLVERESMANV